MIQDLKRYPAYLDSRASWLKEMPAHWELIRARYLFSEVDQRSQAGEETHLSMSQTLGLVPNSMVDKQILKSESYAGGKLCEAGDLVLNRLKAHLGVFARASQPGVVSPDYTVLRPKQKLEVRYFEELLRSPACRIELRIRAKGIVEGFWRLYTDEFNDIRLPVPPLIEQTAIVRFLDYTNKRIRRAIRAKYKLIALISEQIQGIISHVVTWGLNPDVRLKPSGVEWLGDIPEHWEVLLNQRIFKEEVRSHDGQPETQLSLSQRCGLIATSDMQERSLQTSSYDNWKVTIPGDLVLNRFKAHLGVFFAATIRAEVHTRIYARPNCGACLLDFSFGIS